MLRRDSHDRYLASLFACYEKMYPASRKAFERGQGRFPNGVAQVARMLRPFPPFVSAASGTWLETVDGVALLDFWQGHFCSIFGHNPEEILSALQEAAEHHMLLQVGVNTELEEEVASLLAPGTGFEQVIFANSGATATMQAIMLALAHTKRSKIIKIAGGWHGAHPWSLKAVRFGHGTQLDEVEGAGVPSSFDADVLVVPHNDRDALHACFRTFGADIGACIVELVLGNAGMVMADPAFIRELRDLAYRHGAVLIIDELVTGYRVRSGCMYPLFGIEADIVTIGKSASGGMPFACIAGRPEILRHASTENVRRVWADNGTFMCHPGSLVASRAALRQFQIRGSNFFSNAIQRMDDLRARLIAIFAARRISTHVTGERSHPTLPNFPIGTVRFLRDEKTYNASRAISHWDNASVDIALRDQISKIALLLRGVHSWQGLGVVSDAHSKEDIDHMVSAYEAFADDIAESYDVGRDARN